MEPTKIGPILLNKLFKNIFIFKQSIPENVLLAEKLTVFLRICCNFILKDKKNNN